ncbi:MAG: hypothetical protein IJN77_00805 [Oscillospiraceae bacterium]|nr:hypothetical protein [Oscillospiraceae bacterium]
MKKTYKEPILTIGIMLVAFLIMKLLEIAMDIEEVGIYADILAGVGATFLGVNAWLQNDKLHKLEERADVRENGCEIFIQNSRNVVSNNLKNEYAISYEESDKYMQIIINNYGDVFLKVVKISFGNHDFYSTLTLAKGDKIDVRIKLPLKGIRDDDVYKIEFISCYDVSTYGDFKVITDKNSSVPYTIKNYHFYGTKQPK